MNNDVNNSVDFIFIGMGAANSLLFLKMYENNLLQNKKIAIIEPNSKIVNDRNFCFWATEEEVLKLNLENLVSTKWGKIKVANRENQTILPANYYHIKGIDLYNKVKEKLKEQSVNYYPEAYNGIPVLESKSYVISLTDKKIYANKVFDSRPPSYKPAEKNQSHLLQSFYGWELKVHDYTFDTSTMVMMDFNIPQNSFCQFMYVLPFTENTALFEVTRFGKEKITKDEAEKLLTDYLAGFGFSYQILDEEKGIIPMSSLEISNVNYGENWIYTGSTANMIKPTTGYAFHNMAIDANNHVEAMVNQRPFLREKPPVRFKFYDNLLLKIIEETPQNGKKIFQNLFNHTSVNTVLTFLSEKSSLRKEIFIFLKLPLLVFLRAAFKDIFIRFTSLSPIYYAFISTLVSILFYSLNLKVIPWLFIGVGFFSIGLSHGAIDHLTDIKINNRQQLIKFILGYLLKGSFLGLIWIILPDLALIVFITFSAWHFGQADFKEWKYKQGFNSFLWGLIILTIILFYHEVETIAVLRQINGLQIHHLLSSLSINQLYFTKLSLSIFSILFAAFHRSKLMLLTVCYLLLSTMLPLIVSFGIYFVVQHSLNGWRHLKNDLKINSYNLWLKALPYSIGAVLLIFIFTLVNMTDYIGVFFIVLSCISIPHIISMNSFYARISKNGADIGNET
jgi:lycopene beta-cyclase